MIITKIKTKDVEATKGGERYKLEALKSLCRSPWYMCILNKGDGFIKVFPNLFPNPIFELYVTL